LEEALNFSERAYQGGHVHAEIVLQAASPKGLRPSRSTCVPRCPQRRRLAI